MNGPIAEEAKRFDFLTKKHRKVFRLIHSKSALNRSALSRQMGLNSSSLSYTVSQLIDWGFLKEGEREPVPRGQPLISLEVEPQVYFQAGVSVEATQLSIALSNLRGEFIEHETHPGDFGDPRAACDFIADRLENSIGRLQSGRDKCLGLGVAVPGNLINHGEYYITPDALIHWSGFRVGDHLSRALGMPVMLENDAKAGAVGELLGGSGAGVRSFYYAALGFGLGGAYLENTKVIRGAQGNLGELGAILPSSQVRPTVPSLAAALGVSPTELGAFDVTDARSTHRKAYLAWAKEASANFNTALDVIAKLLRPEAIILASKLPSAVFTDLRERVTFREYSPARYREIPHPNVLASALDPALAELIGATLLPVHRALY